MTPLQMVALHEWETFYVIVGSSAAALTGLQFVVIAIVADRAVGGEESLAAFGTPTIVHFCAVLTIAAIIAIPHMNAASLASCLTAAGIAGVIYSVNVAIKARRQTDYRPVLEDWLWHVGFPMLAYAALLVSGVVAFARAAGALYVVAAAALFLLFIGIHNAWDSAVYLSTTRHDPR